MQGHTQRIETALGGDDSPSSHPSSIGKYEVVEPIGEGGFGMVYKGFDPFIKRHVAIKTCTSPDKELRQRYFREAEIAGRLDHPNIVRIFDFGTEDETPFLVQEYLGGGDLDTKIEGREFVPIPERLLYLIHIARGLAYAHDQGIIHRDIKPANVRILEDGTAKIMDFGVAMLQNTETRLTKDGMAVGTAAYLAPEQVKGETPDNRSDIFSYGVLAYELLTGERPFEQDSISATLFSILHDDPKPITLPLHVCPASLRRLIERCMDKDPANRPSDFAQILADLDRVRADLRPNGGDRDLDAELRHVAPQSTGSRSSRGFDPEIRHEWAPPSIRMQRRRRWLRFLVPAALLALAMLLVAYQDRLPWPAAASHELDQVNPPSTSDAVPASSAAAATDEAATWSQAPLAPPANPQAERQPAEDLDADELSPAAAEGPTESAVAASGAMDLAPEAAPPPVVEKATLILDRGWHRAITVSVDGGEPENLRQAGSRQLEPGEHVVRYSLATADYSASQTLRIELDPGEERRLANPLGRPGNLSVQASLGSPQGLVRVNGRSLGPSPVRGLALAPGRHQLEVFSVNDPSTPLASSTVDIRSTRETVITFDLTGQRELSVRYRDQVTGED